MGPELEVLFTDQRTLITDQCGDLSTGSEQRATFFANFKVAKLPKLAGQLAQDAQVEKSIDISGFGSRGPRGPSGFKGGASPQNGENRR